MKVKTNQRVKTHIEYTKEARNEMKGINNKLEEVIRRRDILNNSEKKEKKKKGISVIQKK